MLSALLLVVTSVALIECNVMDLMDGSMEPVNPNYCNNSAFLEEAGLIKATLGQFLGYECSEEFYHCRWQSDGFRTYRKKCKTGLVYDVLGTQNCNYDYNVKSCGSRRGAPLSCNATDFHCSLSEQCLPMARRCDGHYDCALEEDEQNCPLCTAGEFACVVSEQCIPLDRRCNGIAECSDGTDERDCEVCGHGLFHCGKSGECIPMDERCDGRRQCPHGEDEMLCKKPEQDKKFTCQSRDYEIPSRQVCDGIPQCPDGSDEIYCQIPQQPRITLSSIGTQEEISAPKKLALVTKESEPATEDYEYEEGDEEEEENVKPSFTLVKLPPMAKARPAPVRTPPTARPAFGRPRPRPKIEVEKAVTERHQFVQPTYVEVTAAPAKSSSSSSRRTRYPTKAVSSVPVMAATAPPPTRRSSSRPSSQREKIFTVTSAPIVDLSSKEDIIRQISSHVNGGMSPELLAKIERLLSSSTSSATTRHPTTRKKTRRITPAPVSEDTSESLA